MAVVPNLIQTLPQRGVWRLEWCRRSRGNRFAAGLELRAKLKDRRPDSGAPIEEIDSVIPVASADQKHGPKREGSS